MREGDTMRFLYFFIFRNQFTGCAIVYLSNLASHRLVDLGRKGCLVQFFFSSVLFAFALHSAYVSEYAFGSMSPGESTHGHMAHNNGDNQINGTYSLRGLYRFPAVKSMIL
ncbi:hypothetical protein DFJ43DRAFT_809611 [Lentinula guzmanii]|uniref:Uncharacterized protein n=1 Tax=Lentinula guzmanii TaxID=2804957 RepID=A0AA38JH37_9AGAR|nr:hypothetical protein DFJ43DRAFT_809611 [Lentinula guzmanii]